MSRIALVILIATISVININFNTYAMLSSWDHPPVVQLVTPETTQFKNELGRNLYYNSLINMDGIDFREPYEDELEYTCHQFTTKTMLGSAQIFSSDDRGISNVKKVFQQIQQPIVGAAVLYTRYLLENGEVDLFCQDINKNRFLLHSGIVKKTGHDIGDTIVESKCGEYQVVQHKLFDILEFYGNTASFHTLHPNMNKQLASIILYDDAGKSFCQNRETYMYIEDPFTIREQNIPPYSSKNKTNRCLTS